MDAPAGLQGWTANLRASHVWSVLHSPVDVSPHCLQGPWFWAAKTEGRLKVSDWTKASATAVFGEGRNPGAAGQMMGRKNRGNQLKAGLKTRFGDLKEKEVGAGCTRLALLGKGDWYHG